MQVVNVQDPRACGFSYNPKWQELQIVLGVSLVLNKRTLKFEIDRTPGDEPELVPLQALSLAPNAASLHFKVEHEGEEIQFNLSSKSRFDQVLYAAVIAIQDGAFAFNSTDEDSVELSSRNGVLTSLIVRKIRDPAEPYLNLFFKEEGVYHIVHIPHQKQSVSKLGFDGDALVVNVEDKEHRYIFSSQRLILELVKDLFSCPR